MATIPKKTFEYKIEKNIPVIRSGAGKEFDKTLPEYLTMMKLKVGDSFEFPADRINKVQSVRVHLKKEGSQLTFTFPTKATFKKNSALKSGRCWRVKDGSFKQYGPRKDRPKGKDIDLTEHKS